ncbi:MAG: lipoyl protein ligase domain-containing protein [Planctomyces sp.]
MADEVSAESSEKTGILTDASGQMAVDWKIFIERRAAAAEVRLLGIVDHASLMAIQELFVHETRQRKRLSPAVLVYEHPPTISVGIHGNLLELPSDPRELESKLISVHRVQRSGRTIMHQPGQLIVSVVASLEMMGLSKTEFHSRLQEAVLLGCSEFQVVTRRSSEDPDIIEGRHGIVAEIATSTDEEITGFGIFLNVSCRLDEQRLIGRGLLGCRISSLNAERVRPTQMSGVRTALIRTVCEGIGFPEYHIYTGHPLLKRTRISVHDQSSDH